MTTLITITTTPRRQGKTTIRQYPTLQAARAAISVLSDRHLTPEELKVWREGGGK